MVDKLLPDGGVPVRFASHLASGSTENRSSFVQRATKQDLGLQSNCRTCSFRLVTCAEKLFHWYLQLHSEFSGVIHGISEEGCRVPTH